MSATLSFTGSSRPRIPTSNQPNLKRESYTPSSGTQALLQPSRVSETIFQTLLPPYPWTLKVSANLVGLRSLDDGWDGPRSVRIDDHILNRAGLLLREALSALGENTRPPFIVPLSNGGVQIEWHRVHGELEFELYPKGPAAIWIRDHGANNEIEADGAEAFNKFLLWAPRIAQERLDVADVRASDEPAFVETAL